jgi:hypothetical protein
MEMENRENLRAGRWPTRRIGDMIVWFKWRKFYLF